jgi:hypothetical protein
LALALGAGLSLPTHAAGDAKPQQPRYLSGSNGDPNGSGSAKTVTAPNGSQAAQLTSVHYGYGVVSAGYPASTTFSQLSQLSTQYILTQGSCLGGAPRYQIDLQPHGDTNLNDGVSLYVNFGTPPYGGCPSGSLQAEPNIIGGTTPQWQIFGTGYNSNSFYTYQQIESMFGNFQMLDTQIALDGGWAQQGDTQQALIQNWDVNGTVFFASPGGNVTCSGPLAAGTYRNVTVTATCSIDSGVLIEGNLTVIPGGTLVDNGATIEGNLTALGAGSLQIEGSSIGGNLQVQSNVGTVDIGGNVVDGNLMVSGNGGGGTLTNNSAGNTCQLQNNHPPITGSGNTAGHNNTCNQTA